MPSSVVPVHSMMSVYTENYVAEGKKGKAREERAGGRACQCNCLQHKMVNGTWTEGLLVQYSILWKLLVFVTLIVTCCEHLVVEAVLEKLQSVFAKEVCFYV